MCEYQKKMFGSWRRIVATSMAALMLALVAGACASAPKTVTETSTGEVAPAEGSVGLVVHNDNYADMDVYVVSEGLATRIATVTGNSVQRFWLDPSFFPTDQLRIVATPIGGNGRASSGALSVSSGQTIDFTIAPSMRQSTATVR
jgi:hypothetical protein